MPATLLLTDSLADELANAVRRGVPIGTAVRQAGLSHETFYEWLRVAESGSWSSGTPVDPESLRTISAFSEKIVRARADHQAQMIAAIQRCATEENPKTGLPDWRAADAMLSKHPAYRKDWREHREVVTSGEVRHLHEHKLVKELELDTLEANLSTFETLPEASTTSTTE